MGYGCLCCHGDENLPWGMGVCEVKSTVAPTGYVSSQFSVRGSSDRPESSRFQRSQTAWRQTDRVTRSDGRTDRQTDSIYFDYHKQCVNYITLFVN